MDCMGDSKDMDDWELCFISLNSKHIKQGLMAGDVLDLKHFLHCTHHSLIKCVKVVAEGLMVVERPFSKAV